MLSSNELSFLYKIISDENQSFENISKLFAESFKKSDYLKIALSLSTLIKDNLLNVHQRLISFYILYFIQKSEQLEINPFLPLIIETIQITKNKNEQSFLLDILLNQINYLNVSVKNYIQDNSKTVKLNIPYIQKIYEKYNLEKNKLGNYVKINDYIRHIVYDRKKSDIKNIDNHPNIDISKSINIKDELSYNYFEPNYMSFCPMNLNINNENGKKIFDMEPFWIMPNLKHNFIWENEKKENLNNDEKK
jgi:hypothetical protein